MCALKLIHARVLTSASVNNQQEKLGPNKKHKTINKRASSEKGARTIFALLFKMKVLFCLAFVLLRASLQYAFLLSFFVCFEIR